MCHWKGAGRKEVARSRRLRALGDVRRTSRYGPDTKNEQRSPGRQILTHSPSDLIVVVLPVVLDTLLVAALGLAIPIPSGIPFDI